MPGKCTCVHVGLRVHVVGVYPCAVRGDTHVHMGMGMCTPCQSAQPELILPGNVTAMPGRGAEQALVLLLPREGHLTQPTPKQFPM